MLTEQHLAVVRAALQFWTDEMSPHKKHVWRFYFDSPDDAPDLPVAEETQRLFQNCRLRQLRKGPHGWCEAEADDATTSTITALFSTSDF